MQGTTQAVTAASDASTSIPANTTLSLDVAAGPVVASFGRDATTVSLTPALSLSVVGTATYTKPGTETAVAAGGLMGEGVLVGGALGFDRSGVNSASLSAGAGVNLDLKFLKPAASAVMKMAGLVTVPVGTSPNGPQ